MGRAVRDTHWLKGLRRAWRASPRRLRFGVFVLGAFALAALAADFLAPYDPAMQDREHFHAPPATLYWMDQKGGWSWRPYIYRSRLEDRIEMIYREDRTQAFSLKFFVAREEYRLLGVLPCRVKLFGVDAPARIFLFGSDGLGRDVLSRLLYGARVSLSIAAAALLISFPLAIGIGSLAGYYGGAVDFVCMRAVELFLALPAFYLIIALSSALPRDVAPEARAASIMAMIALFGWASLARIVRGMVLGLRERDFVASARAAGCTDWRILRRHVWPQIAGLMLVQAALAAPGFMLAEVTLSYLGLGVQEPLPSWGGMLATGQNVLALTGFWWTLAPGAAILFVCFGFHMLADGLREALDPRAASLDWGD
ncbi:MAG: ABC transporter permease [Blastocatellales bacterium]|nr:ABC transporter permease [Blastocatellales bacterium]